MSDDKRYNGWTNYETWNLALWLSNDSGSYDYWTEQAQDAYDSAEAERSFSREENATLDLAKRLQSETEDQAPEVSGFYADVLSAAISEVNWYEIAEHYIEDCEKEAPEPEETDETESE